MLKPYEEYKNSIAPFTSNKPSHWTEKRLTAVCSRKCVQNNKGEELLSIFLNRGVISYKESNQKQVHKPSEDLSKYQLVEPGDLVLNNQQAWRGSVGVSKYRGIVSPAYYVYSITDELNPSFLNYMVRDRNVVDQFVLASKGVGSIQRMLNNSYLKNVIFTIPPREEQDQIVRYLDWKLAQINKLIRAKKKQIALLNEQRKATIDKAIMYGINPRAGRKESGIIWLDKIPSQWPVMKLKRVCRINASISSQLKRYSLEDSLVFLPMENISSDGKINCSEKRKLKDVKNGFSSFAKNDVIVAKITPCFENGKGACLDNLETDIGFGTTELIVLRANEKILPRYLYMITQLGQFRIQGAEVMTGSAGQKRVPSDFISNFRLGIPSIAEQYEILNYLDDCLAKIDKIYMALNDGIKLLYEYRTRLISDVVTGKVDVRTIEIPEYEAVPDDVTADELDGENAMDGEAEDVEVE